MDTVESLVERIGNPRVTVAVIQNLESRRKNEITVELLLDLAFALEVPPILLLTDMADPSAAPGIPGLSPGMEKLTQQQFDAWFSGVETYLYDIEVRVGSEYVQALTALRDLHREAAIWAEEDDLQRRLESRITLLGLDEAEASRLREPDARHELRRHRIEGLFAKASRKLPLQPSVLPWNQHG